MDKFNFTSKLHLLCSSDELRPAMNCVHFVGGYAYASNGYALIKQEMSIHSVIDAHELDGKCIHREAFKSILRFDVARANTEGVECKNKEGDEAFFPYFDLQGTKMPDFEDLITRLTGIKQLPLIGLNANRFKEAVNAMYLGDSGNIKLVFRGVDKPIVITDDSVDGQIVVLMPVLIQYDLFKDSDTE